MRRAELLGVGMGPGGYIFHPLGVSVLSCLQFFLFYSFTAMETQKAPSQPLVEVSVESKPPNLQAPAASPGPLGYEYPSGIKLATTLACLYATIFIVALDRTIIGVAVPSITNDFHSIDDIGWYASAFLLPACAFILVFGKLYQLYSIKYIYL